jgi:GNAT superfamily N-acetyltransferase
MKLRDGWADVIKRIEASTRLVDIFAIPKKYRPGLSAMKAQHTATAEIRPAAQRDIEMICEFVEELLVKWDARATRKDARRVYEHIMKSPDLGIILVAETAASKDTVNREHRLSGFAYASYEWRSEFGGETMELVEMFVEPSSRSTGVGRTLLNALIVRGRERGIRRFSCQVHPGNSAIERALESCGLDPERRTVWSLNF